MKQNKRQFLVTVPMPRGVTVAEMRQYIDDAVGSWKGQFHPEEPLFDLRADDVTVRTVKSEEDLRPTLEKKVAAIEEMVLRHDRAWSGGK